MTTGTLNLGSRLPGQFDDLPSTGGPDSFHPIYNRNRIYDSSTGRYLQPEPMLQNPGLVLGDSVSGRGTFVYSYAYNNPLHYVDPTGLQGMDTATAGCLAGSPSACAALGYETAAALKAALELASQVEEAAKRSKWSCTATCNIQQIPGQAPDNCPERVTGTGTGPTETEACLNAKRSATQSAPPGTYARHCQCACVKR